MKPNPYSIDERHKISQTLIDRAEALRMRNYQTAVKRREILEQARTILDEKLDPEFLQEMVGD